MTGPRDLPPGTPRRARSTSSPPGSRRGIRQRCGGVQGARPSPSRTRRRARDTPCDLGGPRSSDHAERDDEPVSHSMGPAAKITRLAARGTGFARYQVEGEVARGGMGAILRVWDEDLRRHLAMKVDPRRADAARDGRRPRSSRARSRASSRRRRSPASSTTPASCPCTSSASTPSGRVYFTMKLVKGRDLTHDLRARLRRARRAGTRRARSACS